MQLNGRHAVHFFLTKQSGYQEVNRAHGHQAHPTQGTRVHMAYRPIGVMAQGIDGLDRHHGPFKGTHAVKGQGHDHEAQHGVVT